MENNSKFSRTLQKVFSLAEQLAKDCGSSYIGCEHLVLAILNCPESTAYKILIGSKASEAQYRKYFTSTIDKETKLGGYTPRTQYMIDEAIGFGGAATRTKHLLMAIINSPDCIAMRILRAMWVDMNMLKYDTEFVVKLGVEE